ncbi:MAG: nucleotide exchange factor GrpE [Candidatus Omnitrophica bacterium]|nr:nucleotide exchange factor GrpE [Candidatus Omnitrophota bacterium]
MKAEPEKPAAEPKPALAPADEVAGLKDQLLRLRAEFENARKRWLKEVTEVEENSNADLLRELLDIYDDFERALATVPAQTENKPIRSGVEMIAKRMEGFLKSYGVTPMETQGKLFDPLLHEAVAHEENASVQESTVLEELKKGYLINGRVLRHAMVKVAVHKEG